MGKTVEIAYSTAGVPLRVKHEGRVWTVGAEPIRWFERVDWWKSENRMQRGAGISIEVKIWKLQVRLGDNQASEMRTWEVVFEPNTGRCSLRSDNGQEL